MSEIIFQWYTQSPDLDKLIDGVDKALNHSCKSLLILACDDNKIETEVYNTFLMSLSMPICGGIYPKLTFDNLLMSTGFIVIGFKDELQIHNFLSISQRSKEEDTIELEIELYTTPSIQSYFIFYDTFTSNSEIFIDTLFYSLGNVQVIGGGAGSLSLTQKPCLFSNDGLLQDACQLVSIDTPLHLNVSHGWKTFKGPYLVTDSDKKKLYTLNYKPAINVYKQAIESTNQYTLNDDNFFSVANRFPLGIQGAGTEILVRDIFKKEQNYLECVGDIPINSMIYVLTGDEHSLTSAIKNNSEINKHSLPDVINSLFMVNCVSRYLYLEEYFHVELEGILKKYPSKHKMFGVLSMGEVTNSYSGAIKLLNRTTVLGGF